MYNFIKEPLHQIHKDFTVSPEAFRYIQKYRSMSCAAKWLYVTLADMHFRAKVSDKYDSRGYACLRVSGKKIAEELNCHIQKARKALNELVSAGLVAVSKSEGQKNRIYFLDYTKDKEYMDYKTFLKTQSCAGETSEHVKDTDLGLDLAAEWPEQEDDEAACDTCVYEDTPETYADQSDIAASPENQPGDKKHHHTIILKNNKYMFNKYLSVSDHVSDKLKEKNDIDFDMADYRKTEDLIKQNISYDYFREGFLSHDTSTPGSLDELDELVDIMMDCMITSNNTIRVGKENKPAEVVRSRLMKLNSSHIEYIFYSLRNTRTEIKNIKNYLVTTLYNAVSTMSSHINLQVSHDLYGATC